ncbi:MAG: hypothetical protein LUE64_01305 [Candidatus Gastranaerophilales bacterium]|nr:hypothetical protein [Candidatus Gastranaerophilales bacterium]
MEFYGLVEKAEFEFMIRRAKEASLNNALEKLRRFDAMNQTFFKTVMPDDTPDILIKKRTNKLMKLKCKKELKRLLG